MGLLRHYVKSKSQASLYLLTSHRWNSNQALMRSSCAQWHQANNSPEEINDIHSAVLREAALSGVDSRLILATILQESGGCVRAPTTSNGVNNPGLMQTHDGTGTCANTNPCPSSMIHQMVCTSLREPFSLLSEFSSFKSGLAYAHL
jgi:soluble lytic murein transglycosylase-like protein